MSACSSRVAWSVYTFSVLVICLQAVNAAADDDRVRMPVMKWAERVDKIFLTFMVPGIFEETVKVKSGSVTFRAMSAKDGETYEAKIKLFKPVKAKASTWVTHQRTGSVDLTLLKETEGRWFQLFKGQKTHPKLSTDWPKYLDYDDELDEIERKSGTRGVEPQGDPTFKRAVDDYWRRERIKKNEAAMPDLDAVNKAAEKEFEMKGGDFNEIVQRLWAQQKSQHEAFKKLQDAEDEWAEKDEI